MRCADAAAHEAGILGEDEDAARRDLRRTIKAARANGVPLEMILKDVSTVRYDPKRLWRWAEIAIEESETLS